MRHSFQHYLKNYLRVIFLWCPVVSLLFIFGFGGHENFLRNFTASMTIAVTVSACCYFGAWLIHFAHDYYNRRRGKSLRSSWPYWGILNSLPFLIPGLYLGFLLAAKVTIAMGGTASPPVLKDYSSGIIFGILVSGFFTLFEVVRESKRAKIEAELKFRAVENEKLKAQISALTAQMNPHLLFNSLNTIASTITTDPASAEDMVVKLSELYRGILKSAKGDMHSLENELQLCISYLEIEKKRFGARIDYKVQVDKSVDVSKVRIPVLLLQPLVENAIKHGLAPIKAGGRVTIEVGMNAEHLVLRVMDNGAGLKAVDTANLPAANTPKGTGSGLSNCESRVRLKYGSESKFSFHRSEENETMATIFLPAKLVHGD
jgi:signal transduction histidine kinase